MRVLFDVNILVDALVDREPFNAPAQQLILCIERQHLEGFLTADSLTNLYYGLHRLTHDKSTTRRLIQNTFKLFDILDVTASDCHLALASPCPDFEDALLIETAHRHHLDYIVTRNPKDFAPSSVPVITPENLLQKLHS